MNAISKARAVSGTLAIAIVSALALAACSSASPAPNSSASPEAVSQERETVTITDELGREVELEVPIRAVYPDLWYQTEIVRAIGAGDTIVGIEDTSSPTFNPRNAEYFAEFADTPSAGDYNEPNWEAIVESGAEVFFARRNSPWQEAEEKLAPFGIDVVVITAWDPIVLRENLPLIGEIFGEEEGAAQLASLYDDIDAVLTEKLAGVEDTKSVYFENNADFVTSIPGSGWHDTIVLGGGENIFGDVNIGNDSSASVHTYTVDPVEIINRNPDVIIHAGADGESYGYDSWDAETFQAQVERIAARPGWDATTAVQDQEVYVFNNFFYSALGKQIGALAVAKWLYPEEFADVDLDEYFARWLEPQGVEARPAADYFYKLGS